MHKTIKIEGGELHYFVSGENKPETILFLHPAFGDHRCFDQQIDYFSSHFRVITLDLPGHGLSGLGNSKYKVISTHRYIEKIMLEEAIEQVHLVGVSLGSLVAQDFALKYPEKTLSLTALGGYSINRKQKEVEKSQRKLLFKLFFKFIFSMDAFRRELSLLTLENELEQARFFESAKGFTRKSIKAMLGLDQLIAERTDFQRTHPLLILIGDKDVELAIRKAKEWCEEEPGSNFYIIENAGHCANMDNAKKFNELLINFLKGIK